MGLGKEGIREHEGKNRERRGNIEQVRNNGVLKAGEGGETRQLFRTEVGRGNFYVMHKS